ncbi:DNA repair and recombination protein RadA [Orchesella cincta]|uniref:DNA repair and recombination protein RadA n=1 Tax=Orchesella cincta TaxID=48709 RepID=A0A1D2MAV7_ORCCI|nr:DNA repair and recombination protein RadA [Orchesella cincta]
MNRATFFQSAEVRQFYRSKFGKLHCSPPLPKSNFTLVSEEFVISKPVHDMSFFWCKYWGQLVVMLNQIAHRNKTIFFPRRLNLGAQVVGHAASSKCFCYSEAKPEAEGDQARLKF